MPRRTPTDVPKLCHHKHTGQAVVRVEGRDYYLGPHGADETREHYDRFIAEWLANGRQVPKSKRGPLKVADVILAYWRFAETYYRKNDRPTSELRSIKDAMRPLRRLYGRTAADEFGPLALKAVRETWIAADLARSTINHHVDRIKRMFKWATQNELVRADVYHALQTVPGLKRGRSAARDPDPVRPVPEEHIVAVYPYVSSQVQAMIELQLLTGMRPGEVRSMRACDLDTTEKVWTYTPESHKTEHHGHERVIYLGPQAQEVVRPFLRSDTEAYLFSPREAEAQRRAAVHAKRKTPLGYGNRPGTNRSPNPQRSPGDQYTREAYTRAVRRACEKADVPRWHPHQLRHNAATRFRKQYGLEMAQIVLGHRTAAITQLYAERDLGRARELMGAIG